MSTKKTVSSLLLLLTAMIWGVAFVAQSAGMDYVGPYTFNCVRTLLGAAVLLPFMLVIERSLPKRELTKEEKKKSNRTLIIGGLISGAFLFAGSTVQQVALQTAAVGKVSFITALYIVFVPVAGIFLRRKVPFTVWISVVLAGIGLYLLSIKGALRLELADTLALVGSFCFVGQVMTIDHFVRRTDGLKLSWLQLFFCGIMGLVPMFIFETPNIHDLLRAWIPICYAGALSSAVGFTLQTLGQRNLDPTVASLIMGLESVMGALAGWIILGEQLTTREVIGCVVMFCGIVLAQLPAGFFGKVFNRVKETEK